MTKAREWIRTNPQGVLGDIARLGFDNAVEYQLELIEDRTAMGDKRWAGITEDAMRKALTELVNDPSISLPNMPHHNCPAGDGVFPWARQDADSDSCQCFGCGMWQSAEAAWKTLGRE